MRFVAYTGRNASGRKRKLRTGLGLVLIACLAVCAWWWVKGTASGAGHVAGEEGGDRSHRVLDETSPAEGQGVTPPGRDLPVLPSGGPRPPIIDEITVEKAEVCEGEENLVTVRAHTADGNDSFLHYQIGPIRGDRVGLRSFLDNQGNPTAHRLSVFSRDNVATSLPVPTYRVKRCEDLPVAVVEYRLLPNSWADFEFRGKVVRAVPNRSVDSDAPIFRPRRYRWWFGESKGKSESVAELDQPTVTHSFAERSQATLYTSLLVTLEIVDEDGRVIRARQALELRNPAFEAFIAKRIVQLLVELQPRFPELGDDGVVEQRVRLWHTRPDPVEITGVTVVRRRGGREREASDRPMEHPSVSAVLGGTTTIPPGRGLEVRVTLDTRREPDSVAHDFYLEGHSREGHRVQGSFSVMRPPERPTRERHRAVDDPLLVAKIKRARELLRREFVTDEDLWRLERDGKFSELGADTAAGPAERGERPSAEGPPRRPAPPAR